MERTILLVELVADMLSFQIDFSSVEIGFQISSLNVGLDS